MRSIGGLARVDELNDMLGDVDIRIVDCRFSLLQPERGHEEYLAGHIPGAVYAHLDNDLAGPVTKRSGRHPLPEPEVFIEKLREFGISNESRVVVYDDSGGGVAARLWWMLRWLGHNSVALLDGGLAAWQAAGLSISTDVPVPVAGTFSGRPAAGTTIAPEELQERLASSAGYVLVDARDADRFHGRHEPIDKVAGHVPGALNLPFSLALSPGGRWRDAAELRALWADVAPLSDNDDWAVMCGSGVTACHLSLSAELAGLPQPRLYAGSWSEWICDPKRSLVKS